jgi:hypothetical protein
MGCSARVDLKTTAAAVRMKEGKDYSVCDVEYILRGWALSLLSCATVLKAPFWLEREGIRF